MFDGVDRDDRGDVDGEEDRGGGADAGLVVEAERGEQRPAGGELDRPGAELGGGGPGARRGLRKTASPARTWISARCRAAPSLASAAAAVAAHQHRGRAARSGAGRAARS